MSKIYASLLTILTACFLLAACDKLEDSDVTADNLMGKWAFSYKTTEPLGYELSYQYVVFNADGTCALVYDGGQLEGTFRASREVIRIDTTTDDGKERILLWRVESMSPYQIVAEYDYEFNDGHSVTLTVTLDRV